MGRFPNVIYAMNESLLDEVEVDKVVDEDGPNVEYVIKDVGSGLNDKCKEQQTDKTNNTL